MLISEMMTEDAESDVTQADTVQDVLGKLVHYFYYNTDEANNYGMKWADVNLGDPEMNGTYYILFAETAGIEIPGLMFLFGKKQGYHTTGMNARASKPIFGHNRIIFVWCTRSDDNPEDVKKVVCHNMTTHQVIKHELIHLLDHDRRKKPKTKADDFQEDPHSNMGAYYNSPAEFNAYFHNMVDRLTGMIAGMRKEPQHAKDYADLYDYKPDFITMLKDTLSTGGFEGLRGFLKLMNPERKQRAIKRIYALHQYAGQLLKAAELDSEAA